MMTMRSITYLCLALIGTLLIYACGGGGSGDPIIGGTDPTVAEPFMRVYENPGDQYGGPVAEIPNRYLFAGDSEQAGGNFNILLKRTDFSGAVLTERLYGGTGDAEIWAMAVAGNNLWLAGGIDEGNTGTYKAYLVRTDLLGNNPTSWTFGGDNLDLFQAVTPTSDGGVIACGYSDSAPWATTQAQSVMYVVKLDPSGQVNPGFKTLGSDGIGIGGIGLHDCWAVVENSEGYLLAGLSDVQDSNEADAYLVQLDHSGNILRDHFFGVLDEWEEFLDLKPTSDGDYIAAGIKRTAQEPDQDIYLVKFRLNQSTATTWVTEDWNITIGEPSARETAIAVMETNSGDGFVVAGSIGPNDTDGTPSRSTDAYLAKVSSTGTILWERNHPGNGPIEIWSAIHTSDDGFLLGGDILLNGKDDTDMVLIKTDSAGQILPE